MITLTFPWWAAILVLFFSSIAGSLGDKAGHWLYRRMNRWRVEREERKQL
jgi:hypothetical protein